MVFPFGLRGPLSSAHVLPAPENPKRGGLWRAWQAVAEKTRFLRLRWKLGIPVSSEEQSARTVLVYTRRHRERMDRENFASGPRKESRRAGGEKGSCARNEKRLSAPKSVWRRLLLREKNERRSPGVRSLTGTRTAEWRGSGEREKERNEGRETNLGNGYYRGVTLSRCPTAEREAFTDFRVRARHTAFVVTGERAVRHRHGKRGRRKQETAAKDTRGAAGDALAPREKRSEVNHSPGGSPCGPP